MRPLFLAALALAACSSDPPPQCGAGGTSCADAGAPLDRPSVNTPDVQAIDAGFDVADVFIGTDPAPIVDRGATDVGFDVPADNGRCGIQPSERLCSGACVDLATDEANCGACGVICPMPPGVHTRPLCFRDDESTRCALGCEPGWASCNGNPADGCEYEVGEAGLCPRP